MKVLEYTIEASYKYGYEKQDMLEMARVKNEVLKHILRTEEGNNIITEKE